MDIDVEKLETGRELDKQIEREFFNRGFWTASRGSEELCFVPDYSSNDTDAMKVFRELHKRFTNVALHAANGYGLTVWNVIEGAEETDTIGPFNADTPALAICKTAMAVALKAALAAKQKG